MVSIKTNDVAVNAIPIQVSTLDVYRLHWYEGVKRLIDLSLATAALVVCAPLLVLLTLVIVAETPGPPIFIQRRVGKDGRIFSIIKLRTMFHGTEEFAFRTTESDWRVTSVGKFLRATKLDELPQIFNIISGEMSIIGPRPLSVDEVNYLVREKFSASTPGLLPVVRPGLIGLEQINRSKAMSYAERFEFNRRYEENVSASIDAAILLASIWQCRYACLAALLALAVEIGVSCWVH